MKMVKSLLLGTAAGLLAVAGAQAADMPVKAKPVEYVKVCSLYGAGFYYIPGTDTCLKVGGYIRVQTELKAGSSGQAYGAGGALTQAKFDRVDSNDINWTARAVVTLDARTQTDYGTLRSYIRAGWNQSTPGLVGAGTTPCNTGAANNCLAYWDRAFIQFAGFTVGRGQSFFDLFTYGGAYTYLNVRTAGDTGAAGVDLWAYTVQFGNGVSYTLSLEDPSGHGKFGTCDGSAACWTINGGFTNDNGLVLQGGSNNGFRVPDIISNLRIDQAWGYLGLSTAIHDVSGAYYLSPNNVNNGHPADKYGWAIAVGGLLNLAGGDIVGANFVYANGAPGYATNAGSWQIYNNSQSVGIGWTQRRYLRHRWRHPADQGMEHQRGLPAHLGTRGDLGRQVAHDGVWRLRQRLVQRHRQEHHPLAPTRCGWHPTLRRAGGWCGVAAAQHRGRQRQQLQPGLQLLPGWFADAVQPGSSDGYRS